jgi:heterotetrameric sarcosine oxidase gamma subunit
VNALPFASADPASGALARSPMERLATAAGARLEARSGWNVAVAYSGDEQRRASQTVGFADRSHLTKLELQGPREGLARIAREAGDGATLELGKATRAAGAWWCPVTPERLLMLAEPESTASPAVSEATTDKAVTLLDATSGLAAMALIGPGCRELLARFCAIDVRPAVTPVTGFRPGSVARTPGYLLCEREDQLLILVGWALGEYLWEVVADAAESLGGGPVGAEVMTGRLEPAHA